MLSSTFSTDLLPRPGRVLCRVQGLDLALDHCCLKTLVEILEAIHLQGVLPKHLCVFKFFSCGITHIRNQKWSNEHSSVINDDSSKRAFQRKKSVYHTNKCTELTAPATMRSRGLASGHADKALRSFYESTGSAFGGSGPVLSCIISAMSVSRQGLPQSMQPLPSFTWTTSH